MKAAVRVVEQMLVQGCRGARRLIFEANHAERLRKIYPNLPPETIDAAIKADPTGGSYAQWVVDKAIHGVIALPEDTDKVRAVLDRFHRLKQSPNFKGDKNLYTYKTYGDLARAVEDKETKTRTDKIKSVEGLVEITRKGPLSLVRLDTAQAATAVAKRTQWCIKDPRWYDDYKKGGLYAVLKRGQPYVAVHPPSQAMDVYDDPINKEIAAEIAPLFTNIKLHYHAYEEHAEHGNKTRQDEFLEMIHKKWVADHEAGFTNKSGKTIGPMSREEAERIWKKNERTFRRAVPGLGHERGFINQGLINLGQAIKKLNLPGPLAK